MNNYTPSYCFSKYSFRSRGVRFFLILHSTMVEGLNSISNLLFFLLFIRPCKIGPSSPKKKLHLQEDWLKFIPITPSSYKPCVIKVFRKKQVEKQALRLKRNKTVGWLLCSLPLLSSWHTLGFTIKACLHNKTVCKPYPRGKWVLQRTDSFVTIHLGTNQMTQVLLSNKWITSDFTPSTKESF